MTSSARNDSRQGRFAHALQALEFVDVLELIASWCVNEEARVSLCETIPSTDAGAIGRSLSEIAELRAFRIEEGALVIADTTPIGWVEEARERGSPIPPTGLLDIANMERTAIELAGRVKRLADRYPLLLATVESIEPQRELIAAVERTVDKDGGIKDSASPALASLRKRVRRAREELRRLTESLAKPLGGPEHGTYSGNRYMLVVPKEKVKGRSGVVHGASQSGGSLYFEPLDLMDKNNGLETLVHEEQREVARILGELAALVFERAERLLLNVRIWHELDILHAKARFCEVFECVSPALSADGSLRLIGARHPLLENSMRREEKGRSPVPLDLDLTADARILVITGPNAGGKTVSLKTTGLLVLMFQAGLQVPCDEGTTMPVFHAVHADIGDEQSIANSLSTFTSHLRHLDAMSREADERTLCLIDEIGDGTDPDEGTALAVATLEWLRERGAFVVATTHYGKLKSFALDAEGVSNAAVAFDDDEDRPLYRLLLGAAGRSRGIETARRVGFYEPVVMRAESLVGEDAFRLERILSELEASRLAIEKERLSLGERSAALDRLIASYREKERDITEHGDEHRERARRDAEALLTEARREIEQLVKKIRESGASKAEVRRAHDTIKKKIETLKPRRPSAPVGTVAPGDRVALNDTGRPAGTVIDVRKNTVTVEVGGKRITSRVDRLYEAADDAEKAPRREVGIDVDAEPLAGVTLDVRGYDRADALEAVDRFLDRAVLSGVKEIRIIHGYGEGVLARAIADHLQGDPRVSSRHPAGVRDGGAGVTVVVLD